jgi:hypothetical protein
MDVEDMRNLRKAFAALRKAGYIARMNFSCCGTCGWYDLSLVAKDKCRQGKEPKGTVFYHRQAGDRLDRTGKTDLQWEGDQHEICRILRANGVPVSIEPETDARTIEIDFGLPAREAAVKAEAEAWAEAARAFT